MDRDYNARLHVGDLLKCYRCGSWHQLIQLNPDDPMNHVRTSLFYRCPEAIDGVFFAGRIGEVPRDQTRWKAGQLTSA